jgi:hypothetical protein
MTHEVHRFELFNQIADSDSFRTLGPTSVLCRQDTPSLICVRMCPTTFAVLAAKYKWIHVLENLEHLRD